MLSSLSQQSPQSTILTLLKACKSLPNLNQVHTHIIRRGFEQNHLLIAQFISLCTDLSYANSVFDRVRTPNIYLWNIMMKTHCEKSNLDKCLSLFNEMRRRGGSSNVAPDKYTFPSLVKACSNGLGLREGRVVHGVIVRCGTESDVFVGSSLVDFYGKCGEIGCARQVFDRMPVKNEVSWTAMMVGYLSVGDSVSARQMFDEMPNRNEGACNAMLKGLVRFGDLRSARKLFDEMGFRNEVSFTTMIDGYAKSGDMASAKDLFKELPRKDLISWSALMSGYVQNGKPCEALTVFGEMWATNVRPDEFVMVSLMSACSQLGSLELAEWIESYMVNNAFDVKHAHVAAALVDMHAKCGNMERATSLFEGMPARDLISYCSMIQGLCIHGCSAQAVVLFDRMIREGIKPDDVAFTVILTACSRAGLVDDGCRYFDLMLHEYSIVPSPDHYACLVDLLGKSGKLKAAYELIRSQPVESHGGAWGALLGACRLHCDIDLGEEVAGRLFELEPRSGGNYVMLSNIYAEADRWSDVSCLRGKMSERGIQKIPGCSYIESETPA